MSLPNKTYTATLFDCPVSAADAYDAETRFCLSIESELGGEDRVAKAYDAYHDAFMRHDEIPLPPGATDAERAAVELWENAAMAGHRAAFGGWRNIGGAHFEIIT